MKTKNIQIQKVVYFFLTACIVAGIVLRIVPYFYNRSLWGDEATLAASICTRTLQNLVLSPLDWGQSAPVGYLYIVKILTLLFGKTEWVFRIWSLVTSFGSIYILYLLLRNKVAKHYALIFTAIYSLLDGYIYYANELKPYMSDNFFALLVLYLWQQYQLKKVPFWVLIVSYSIIIWFSFVSVFFIAACMILLCFSLLKKFLSEQGNERKKILFKIGICSIVLISFVVYYLFWLSNATENAGGSEYWDLLKFPVIPKSIADIKRIFVLGNQFVFYLPKIVAYIVFLLFVLYILSVIKSGDNSKIFMPFCVALIILLIASYLGFYPIQDRLVQIFCIILFVFAANTCDRIEKLLNTKQWNNIRIRYVGKGILYFVLTVSLVISGMNGYKNLFPSHIYKGDSEVNENMQYLKENTTKDDYIYVYREAIPVYTYLNNYSDDYQLVEKLAQLDVEFGRGLPYTSNHVIYGQSLVTFLYEKPYAYDYNIKYDAVLKDASVILEHDSVYIFVSHSMRGIPELLKVLEKEGTVKVACKTYETRVYHFVHN